MANVLEIIPLGGIGEFGMNCTLMRYGDEMLILDAGMGFPEESVYGVDVCIPDFEILEEFRDDITAIILTHGHEDHLGALPYVLKKIQRAGLRVALHAGTGRKQAGRTRTFRRRAVASRRAARRRHPWLVHD